MVTYQLHENLVKDSLKLDWTLLTYGLLTNYSFLTWLPVALMKTATCTIKQLLSLKQMEKYSTSIPGTKVSHCEEGLCCHNGVFCGSYFS